MFILQIDSRNSNKIFDDYTNLAKKFMHYQFIIDTLRTFFEEQITQDYK